MHTLRGSLAASRAGRQVTDPLRPWDAASPACAEFCRNFALAPKFVDRGPLARGNAPRVGGQPTEFGSLADVVPKRVALDGIPPLHDVVIDGKRRRKVPECLLATSEHHQRLGSRPQVEYRAVFVVRIDPGDD